MHRYVCMYVTTKIYLHILFLGIHFVLASRSLTRTWDSQIKLLQCWDFKSALLQWEFLHEL